MDTMENRFTATDLARLSDSEQYQIHSRLEIIAILRSLIEQRSFVTVYFGACDDFIVSALLAINPDFEELIFDFGANEEANARMVRATDLIVATQLDHIRIQFTAIRAEATTYEGGPAFRIPLPRMLLRLQRREFYRIKVPLGQPLICELYPGGQYERPVAIRVYDISCGGIALVEYPAALILVPGTVYPGCRIDLAEIGTVTTDIEVMHLLETTGKSGMTSRRCGCRFVHFTNPLVTLIQRYIMKIEREQKAHS